MVIYTAKIQWKHLSAILALTAAFALCLLGGQTQPQTVTAAVIARTESAQVSYLESLGWEVSGRPTTDQVQLPQEFGDQYADFLALQKMGGFDLAAYAGQTVTRYSYPISNYPTGETNVMADLLVLDGEIIGGELRSSDLDGFMTGLVAREASPAEQTA